MERIRKITHKGREILVIDFSDLSGDKMIKLLTECRKMMIQEKRQQRLLAIFNEKNYITSKVLRHFETDQLDAIQFSERLVCVGLSTTQKMILKGYNVLFNRDIKPFDKQEEALDYLLLNK